MSVSKMPRDLSRKYLAAGIFETLLFWFGFFCGTDLFYFPLNAPPAVLVPWTVPATSTWLLQPPVPGAVAVLGLISPCYLIPCPWCSCGFFAETVPPVAVADVDLLLATIALLSVAVSAFELFPPR